MYYSNLITAFLLACLLAFTNVAFAQKDILTTSHKDVNIDSLQDALNATLSEGNLLKTAALYVELGAHYGELKSLDTSQYYFDEAIKIYETLRNQEKLFYTHFQKGSYLSRNLAHKDAITAYENANTYMEYCVSDSVKAQLYNNLGLMYQYTGRQTEALDLHLKALRIREKQGDLKGIAASYDNIGINYFERKDYDKALENYNNALALYQQLGDTVNQLRRGYAIGGAFYGRKEYDKALVYLADALELAIKANHLSTQISALQVIGLVHIKKQNFVAAEEYLTQANELLPENAPVHMKIYVLANLSVLYLEWGTDKKLDKTTHLNKAIKLAKQADELSTEVGFLKMNLKANEVLYKAHEELAQYKASIQFARNYILLNDSFLNTQKQDAMLELQEKYEAEKKDLEINLLNRTKELQEAEIAYTTYKSERQQLAILLLASGFLVLVIMLYFIWRLLQQKKKSHATLKKQSSLIEAQNKEREFLLKEIHHRVKNNLQIISSLLDMQMRGMEDQSLKDTLIESRSRVASMALIHQMLYESESQSSVNLNQYIQQLYSHISTSFGSRFNVQLEISGDPEIETNIETSIPLGLMLTEMITNSFKYAFSPESNGKIKIQIALKDEEYHLIYQDTGPGLPDGFDLKKAKSLGLRLVNNLLKQLKGSLEHKNQNGVYFALTFYERKLH